MTAFFFFSLLIYARSNNTENFRCRVLENPRNHIFGMFFFLNTVNPRPYWEDAVGEGGEKGEGHISLPSRFTLMIFNLNFDHQVLSISLLFQLCSCRILHVYRDIVP